MRQAIQEGERELVVRIAQREDLLEQGIEGVGSIAERNGDKNPAAKAFLAFLKGPTALAIIKRYGYEVR